MLTRTWNGPDCPLYPWETEFFGPVCENKVQGLSKEHKLGELNRNVHGCADERRPNTVIVWWTHGCLLNSNVGSRVGVSSVSSISETVSIIPCICLAFAKYFRSLSGRKLYSLRKRALERFACLQRGQERLCCFPGGDAEQMNHDCDEAKQRCKAILRPRCYGFSLEEREEGLRYSRLYGSQCSNSQLCAIPLFKKLR